MKERPILMSAPMVRALLAGTKTQTRRVVKGRALDWLNESGFSPSFVAHPENHLCPYGAPGDRLWVRETWAQNENQLSETSMDTSIVFRADGEARALDNGCEKAWRPSIHMPRWASRITLEINDVRVERLQEISEADALAEGITHSTLNDPRVEYRWLWESINGHGSWDANPWVWPITFRRIAASNERGRG